MFFLLRSLLPPRLPSGSTSNLGRKGGAGRATGRMNLGDSGGKPWENGDRTHKVVHHS